MSKFSFEQYDITRKPEDKLTGPVSYATFQQALMFINIIKP